MKIRELLEYFPSTTKKVKKLPHGYNYAAMADYDEEMYDDVPAAQPFRRNKNIKHLGTGSYGSVYADKRKPHDVQKHGVPYQGTDAFMWYIRSLQKSKIADNPYFPKVRSLKVYETPKKKYKMKTYKLEMERLFELETLEPEEVKGWLERVFGSIEDMLEIYEDMGYGDPEEINPGSLSHIITAVTIFLDGEHDGYCEDEYLLQACKFIKMVEKRYDLMTDIHSGNIMVRRTPYGAQIVLVDPLA